MSAGFDLIGGGFAGLQRSIAGSIGGIAVPGALGASISANPSGTTTAINMAIVMNGRPQGFVSGLNVDEEFNWQRVRAISSAINVDFIPGVYEATAQVDKILLRGVNFENALGGGIRAVIGKYQADPDFRKFYFNIVEVDNAGNSLAVRHDCVLTSLRTTYEINQVIIVEGASLLIRYSDAA